MGSPGRCYPPFFPLVGRRAGRGEADLHCKPLPPTLPLPPFLFRFPTARGKSNQVFAFCFCPRAQGGCGTPNPPVHAGDAAVALRMLVVLFGAALPRSPAGEPGLKPTERERQAELCSRTAGAALPHLFPSRFWLPCWPEDRDCLRETLPIALALNFELLKLFLCVKYPPPKPAPWLNPGEKDCAGGTSEGAALQPPPQRHALARSKFGWIGAGQARSCCKPCPGGREGRIPGQSGSWDGQELGFRAVMLREPALPAVCFRSGMALGWPRHH